MENDHDARVSLVVKGLQCMCMLFKSQQYRPTYTVSQPCSMHRYSAAACTYIIGSHYQIILRRRRLYLSNCRPAGCPDVIHDVMLSCHEHNSEKRPTFTEILTQLKKETSGMATSLVDD